MASGTNASARDPGEVTTEVDGTDALIQVVAIQMMRRELTSHCLLLMMRTDECEARRGSGQMRDRMRVCGDATWSGGPPARHCESVDVR